MTCGLGYADGKNVWIASDRCASDTFSNQSIISSSKVFYLPNAPIICSFAGCFKIYDLLKYRLKIPEKVLYKGLKDKKNTDKFVRTEIVDFIGNTIKHYTSNLVLNKNDLDFSLLMGINGRIFLIEEDLTVLEFLNNIVSIGTGEEVAQGAFTALLEEEGEKDINKILFKTLKIVSERKVDVKPPFDIYHLNGNKIVSHTYDVNGKELFEREKL